MKTPTHPLDDLTAAEMTAAASTVKSDLLSMSEDVDESHVLDEGNAAVARDARGAFRACLERRHEVVGAAPLRVAAVEADERVGASAVALAVAA